MPAAGAALSGWATAVLLGAACASSPYPHSAAPKTLRVYSGAGLAAGDKATLETLGGGLARTRPELYRVAGAVNSTTDAYSLWLSELAAHFGVAVDAQFLNEPTKLLAAYKSQITGYVEHSMSDGSVNAALTYIAGQEHSDLLVAASTPSTLNLLKSWGVPLAKDCTGMTSLQAYKLRGASKFGGSVISFQVSSQYSNLAEYAVFARAPTIEWQCTAKPAGAPDNWQDACVRKHPKGGPTAQQVVSDFATTYSGIKVALGWGPESAYVAALGERGFYVHASDDSHNMAPIANARLTSPQQPATSMPPAMTQTLPAHSASTTRAKHKIAFLMSDGDNIQWMYNTFATQQNWWASPDRGTVPLGWTLSPGLVELGPVILNYLARTATANDDLIAAPSGVGYAYPSVWSGTTATEFGALTSKYMTATTQALRGKAMTVVNTIGDPCIGGVFFPGCKGLNSPNMSAIAPILSQPNVDGMFWYTFGAGYSGWSGTEWYTNGEEHAKPVIGGRFSLWGEGKEGSMLGVTPLVNHMVRLLIERKINTDATSADGYSLFPVHAWSHNVTDVVAVAKALEATGSFETVTPSELLNAVAQNVKPHPHS